MKGNEKETKKEKIVEKAKAKVIKESRKRKKHIK